MRFAQANESGWYREAHALAPVFGAGVFYLAKGGGRMESDLGEPALERSACGRGGKFEKFDLNPPNPTEYRAGNLIWRKR